MNKTQFIKRLSDKLGIIGIKNKVCRGDADAVIVSEAIREATSTHKEVIILGEDIDLLIILTHLASKFEKNVFIFKPEKRKKGNLYYTKKCFKTLEFSRYILFVHGFSG